MPGITYFCRDRHGNVYTRYSAGHRTVKYTHAVIHRAAGTTDPVGKAGIQYSSRLDLAEKNYCFWNGFRSSFGSKTLYEAELVEVLSAEGRHATMPAVLHSAE